MNPFLKHSNVVLMVLFIQNIVVGQDYQQSEKRGLLVISPQYGFSDINAQNFGKTFLETFLSNSNKDSYQVITDASSKSGTAGVNFQASGAKGYLSFDMSVFWKSTSLAGNDDFAVDFRKIQNKDTITIGSSSAVYKYFEVDAGLGFSPTGLGHIVYVGLFADLVLQNGTIYRPLDAFTAFQNNGYLPMQDLVIKSNTFWGYRLRATIGFWFSEKVGMMLNPSFLRVDEIKPDPVTGMIYSAHTPREVIDVTLSLAFKLPITIHKTLASY